MLYISAIPRCETEGRSVTWSSTTARLSFTGLFQMYLWLISLLISPASNWFLRNFCSFREGRFGFCGFVIPGGLHLAEDQELDFSIEAYGSKFDSKYRLGPKWGTPVQMKGYVMCNFPKDSTVALGALSVVALLISAVLGLLSVYFPYNGQRVPKHALFHGTTMRILPRRNAGDHFAEAMMMWATITEGLHRSWNLHRRDGLQMPDGEDRVVWWCRLLALDASLFWLVCQMLTLNARSDYLDYEEQDNMELMGRFSPQIMQLMVLEIHEQLPEGSSFLS
ncbi:hypothetical protein HPP92_028467 [Vanilla planifolia]|uniref:Uncharacterized protein n=1 Tax=Vanilla planifolia TaxID=51239 RepID=A0A835P5K2_VANPL|nr:hypothetical protein HPP92_028467 [Vanilla planifolia]